MADDTLRSVEGRMQNAIEALKKELATIRTGRASPALVEHIKVEYAGVPTPLKQIAGISVTEARLIIIQPWDRSSIHSIEKAILTSDLGLNPVSDGSLIRINVPPLTEERRKEMIKVVRKRVEEGKIEIRNQRREGLNRLKELERTKDISQDEHQRALEQLQKLTDSFISNMEKLGQEKETALMEV